jgi:predicted phosphodiesterase
MNDQFQPQPPDAAGILSWVHLGDLHMTRAGEQNDLDLQAIVAKINRMFAESIAFVYLPGDVADDGSRAAYAVVRASLDRLQVPWCAIVGDHDVHEKSFDNFLAAMAGRTHYAFSVGETRFLALNAFDIPEPPSFTVSTGQLQWVEGELRTATERGQTKVVLIHCYPSDLKAGGEELSRLIRQHNVRLVDMGHTHYNEISNDGRTLYTATRSTGQVEEGPVGLSITNLDGGAVSWRFVELGEPLTVIITAPEDCRLARDGSPLPASGLTVRVKVWSETPVTAVNAALGRSAAVLSQIPGTQVWQGILHPGEAAWDSSLLRVAARTIDGKFAEDKIMIAPSRSPRRLARDQENQIGAWPEHGLLGTQLGPNKNGKKW